MKNIHGNFGLVIYFHVPKVLIIISNMLKNDEVEVN